MPISQYLLNDAEQKRLFIRLRNKWMIRIRWYYLLVLTAAAVITTLLIASDKSVVKSYLLLGGVGLGLNFLLWLVVESGKHRKASYFRTAAVAQMLLDLALASWVIYLQGGLSSRATVLYAIPILITGVLFVGWFAYIAAALSGLAYSATLILVVASHKSNFDLTTAIVPMVFYSSVFLILAALVSRLTDMNLVRQRETSYNDSLALLRHQLQHPISVISAIAEMLESGPSYSHLTDFDKTYLRQLKRENKRMQTMISNLLESSGYGTKTEKIQDVNLVQLVEDSAVGCATAAKRLKDLDARYSGQALMIKALPQQLTTALDNIIDNAFRYSEAGSQVTIAINESRNEVEITVTDHGQGISEKQRHELLGRSIKYEKDNSADGPENLFSLGLGIYVSKMIIERHSGRLTVESSENKGTKVIIKLRKEGL